MGFQYRKSFKAGPFRITASKSGISYSAGVPGARVTKRADGRVQTTLSAPGTGARYTTTHGSKRRASTGTGRATGAAAGGQEYTFVGPAAPAFFRGLHSSITLHPELIEITRKHLAPAFRGRSIIPWQDVLDVEVCMPSVIGGSGYVHVLTRTDPHLLAAPGQRNFPAAMANPNTVIFSNFPTGKRTAKALVEAVMGCVWRV